MTHQLKNWKVGPHFEVDLEGRKECGTSQIIWKPKKYWMHFGFKMLTRPNIRW
jgi:hypothetical protein